MYFLTRKTKLLFCFSSSLLDHLCDRLQEKIQTLPHTHIERLDDTAVSTAWGSAPWIALPATLGERHYRLVPEGGSKSWSGVCTGMTRIRPKEQDLSRTLRSTVVLILLAEQKRGMDLCVNSKTASGDRRRKEGNSHRADAAFRNSCYPESNMNEERVTF